MGPTDSLTRSKAIHRRTGRTFYAATRFLPQRVRHPTYVLYAFFRSVDEVVDDPNPPSANDRRRTLEEIRRTALGERPTDDPVLEAFGELRTRHDIPDREVNEFVDAMAMDVDTIRYDTYGDLEAYLRGSSVAVAYMMLAVMDSIDSVARPHARALGEAFQLTNFLRDVREDVQEYDRVYLPRSIRERHGVTEEDVRNLEFTPGFADAMRDLLGRTEELYREGVAGIQYLPADCQFPVLLAAVLYAEHHRLIRERGYDVLSDRPTLTSRRRARVVLRTWWHWRRRNDPVAAFEAASAVPSADSALDRPSETPTVDLA
ncbi:phytoene/squalene synthase family protein [Halalkalicoccus ordinarius]|uniref:phytoene/squalene synthase family protein n=1 Tax=Halalkalicoccus ordinarius TaxID=3116651 RepID=UPI00300E8435